MWSAVATGEEHTNSFTEAQTITAGIFAGKNIRHTFGSGWRGGRLEYGFAVYPVFFQLRPQAVHGVGFSPLVFRWNSNRAFHSATPYLELGGGGLHTNLNLPAGNTSQFNFTANVGGGFYLPIDRTHAFDVAALWSHISNANLGSQNPQLNAIEIRFAYHWLH